MQSHRVTLHILDRKSRSLWLQLELLDTARSIAHRDELVGLPSDAVPWTFMPDRGFDQIARVTGQPAMRLAPAGSAN